MLVNVEVALAPSLVRPVAVSHGRIRHHDPPPKVQQELCVITP